MAVEFAPVCGRELAQVNQRLEVDALVRSADRWPVLLEFVAQPGEKMVNVAYQFMEAPAIRESVGVRREMLPKTAQSTELLLQFRHLLMVMAGLSRVPCALEAGKAVVQPGFLQILTDLLDLVTDASQLAQDTLAVAS